jgi:tryptophan synthase alpha chain
MHARNRISARFSELAKKGECALICYVVAGYPDAKTSQAVIEMLVQGGADAIEIGIPFSDPIADGPTIEAASHASLQKGTRPADALALASKIRQAHPDLPLLVMTYSNILVRNGFEDFASRAKRSGIDGFIVPDMPMEEAGDYSRSAKANELSTVFLASPNTKSGRLRRILDATNGFLYLVSVFGITGARSTFENYTSQAIKDVKLAAASKVPIAVGFGISRPEHVRFMKSAGADAVIVVSAIIDIIAHSKSKTIMLASVKRYAQSMKAACRDQKKVH